MAKLNESKKSEKALRATLQDVEQRCAEAESKAREAQQLASSAHALQNTIDHLESRLEIANTEKLDAQEELFNVRELKSPFDARFPKLKRATQDAHDSVDTVFSNESKPGQQLSSMASLSASVERIEQLQDEIRHKDAYISDLEGDSIQLRQMLDLANQQYEEINLQLNNQNELLRKAKETEEHTGQLRTAIIEREAVIGEKEKLVRAVERQLEHHKLLLQAEIRKHATMARYLADESNPLPDLSALVTKKDIDRWIQKLNQRLRRAKPMSPTKRPATAVEAHIEDLRNEVDFYVREIIYYKLDIRGYKSDIKKLNRITAQLGSYGQGANDLDSDTSSLRPTPTPSRSRFSSRTPVLKSSEHPSPAFIGLATANMVSAGALTPPPSSTADSPNDSPVESTSYTQDDYEEAASRIPVTPHAPTKVTIISAPHTSPVAATQEGLTTPRGMTLSPAVDVSERLTIHELDFTQQPILSADAHDTSAANNTRPSLLNVDRPTLERGVSDASTVRPVVPTSRFSRDSLQRSPSPKSYQISHSRVGSGSSTISHVLQPQSSSRPEHKHSGTSSAGIPFVIAMGSPHNPAIAVAAKNMPVTRPHTSSSTRSKAGVDGTLVSSPSSVDSTSSGPRQSPNAITGHKRKLSLPFRKAENEIPTTPTHSRSLSSGSIRTAIRWTKGVSKDKEKEGQLRKDSIGSPQPLASPFMSDATAKMMRSESVAIDFATDVSGEGIIRVVA